MYPIADPSSGWKWDLWFLENDAYFLVNSDQGQLNFNSDTTPASYADDGARSFISINSISNTFISGGNITYSFQIEDDLFDQQLISQAQDIEVVGSGGEYIVVDNGTQLQILDIYAESGSYFNYSDIGYEPESFILMDSDSQLAMNLGETYLVTNSGNERLGKKKLDLVIG